jgi:excisionase family DNA binding protein
MEGSGQNEILTLEAVAVLLQVDRKTIYRMAQANELPAFKVRGRWRFRRVDVDEWIRRQLAQQCEISGGHLVCKALREESRNGR